MVTLINCGLGSDFTGVYQEYPLRSRSDNVKGYLLITFYQEFEHKLAYRNMNKVL